MDRKLVSTTQYVLNHPATNDYEYAVGNMLGYAAFIDSKLEFYKFAPLDEFGDILEVPASYDQFIKADRTVNPPSLFEIKECERYQESLARVIFDNIDINVSGNSISVYYNGKILMSFSKSKFPFDRKIEDVITWGLTLTEAKAKELSL